MKQSTFLLIALRTTIIFALLGWMLFNAKLGGIHIPISHLDGNFQTANGLYGIDAGLIFGKDFSLFLGIGPTFLLYPFFKLLGSNFAASVIASQFVVFLTAWFIISMIWHLLCKQKSILSSLAIGAILFLLLYAFNHLAMPLATAPNMLDADPGPYIWQINQFFNPGPSLRATRAALPYFIAAIYYFFIYKIQNKNLKYTLCGALCGLSLLWSNDYAIPTCGLFILLTSCNAYFKRELSFKNIGLLLISTMATWFILMMAITQGSIASFLNFNMRDVLQTQWWYVQPYTEEQRIFHFTEIWKLFYIYCIPSYIALMVFAYLFFKKRIIEHGLIFWIGLTLLFSGTLPSIGGHLTIFYFGAFILWGIFVWATLLIQFLWQKISSLKNIDIAFYKTLFTLFSALLCLILFFNKYNTYTGVSNSLKNSDRYFYVPELGGYMEPEWKTYIELARNNPSVPVIEEYWGIWSAINKNKPLWPVDSLIHALGHTQDIAKKALSEADFIISTNVNNPKAFAPEWQAWGYGQNFWFYEELLKNRTLIAASPTTLVWAKTEQPRTWTATECRVNQQNHTLSVTTPQPGHYIIEAHYKLGGSGRALLLFKTNIQNATQNQISANPDGNSITFPTIFFETGNNTIETKVLGRSVNALELTQCKAHAIDFPYINHQGMMNIAVSH